MKSYGVMWCDRCDRPVQFTCANHPQSFIQVVKLIEVQ